MKLQVNRLSHRPPPPSLQLDVEGGQNATGVDKTQKGQCHRMQQLLYYCFDEPYWEDDDDNPDKKTTGPSRKHLADEQAGFWKDRSTIQQILALRLIAEKAKRKDRTIYNCFVDFQKAFDSISHKATLAILQSYSVGTG